MYVDAMSSKNTPTRNRILESTWRLLESGSSEPVRMSDIAKAAKISRQALYLHFPSRADLLIATTRYIDEVHDIDSKLERSRAASSGFERLDAWIEVWGNYIPVVYGVFQALMAMKDTDKEAMAAWNDRMQAVRHGCAAVIEALKTDDALAARMTDEEATDLLWTLLSVRNWEQLRFECSWSQDRYIEAMKKIAVQTVSQPKN